MGNSTAKVLGLDRLHKKLERMAGPAAKRAVRRAAQAGGILLRKAIRAATPVDEGVLRKAQDYKIIGRNLSRGVIAGANVEKLKAANKIDPSRPTNIDHLVEEGHFAPDGTFIPPSGYMRKAAAEAMPRAEAKFATTLASEIEKAATR